MFPPAKSKVPGARIHFGTAGKLRDSGPPISRFTPFSERLSRQQQKQGGFPWLDATIVAVTGALVAAAFWFLMTQ